VVSPSWSIFVDGRIVTQRKCSIDDLCEELAGEEKYQLVGSPAIYEDADFPGVNVLIIAGAGRGYKSVVQRAGRVFAR